MFFQTAYLIRVQLLGDTHSDSDLCQTSVAFHPADSTWLCTPFHSTDPELYSPTLMAFHFLHSVSISMPRHFILFYYFHVTEWKVDIFLIIINQVPLL